MHSDNSPSCLRSLVSHILTCFTDRPARWGLASLVAACAADPGGTSTAASSPAETDSQDAQTVSSAATDAGVLGGGFATSPSPPSAPVANAQPRDPDVCGGLTFKAQAKELEVLVLFDNSLSMLLPAVGGGDCLGTGMIEDCLASSGLTLWDVAIAELNQFVRDPKSAGMSIALKYFGSECEPSFYSKPDVSLGRLPQHASAIGDSLAATLPLAETATRPALEGALAYARARAAEPGVNARQIILMVTDGYPDPADCSDNSTEAVARIAASASSGQPAIATYVFVTVPELALDPIASAGGTERAIVADLQKVGALGAALGKVRDQELAALPCEYELPPSYFSEVNDPSRVNLTRDGKPIGKVESASDCALGQDAWYYDQPAAPQRILTCAAACAGLKSATTVDVQLKCPTVVLY